MDRSGRGRNLWVREGARSVPGGSWGPWAWLHPSLSPGSTKLIFPWSLAPSYSGIWLGLAPGQSCSLLAEAGTAHSSSTSPCPCQGRMGQVCKSVRGRSRDSFGSRPPRASGLVRGEEAGREFPCVAQVKRGYSCSPGGQELVRPQTQAPPVVVQAWGPQVSGIWIPGSISPFSPPPGLPRGVQTSS